MKNKIETIWAQDHHPESSPLIIENPFQKDSRFLIFPAKIVFTKAYVYLN